MIYITDTLRIRPLDKYCVQLEELRTAKSKKFNTVSEQWMRVGYYGTVPQALKAAYMYLIDNDSQDITTLQELAEVIQKAEDAVTRIASIVG